MAASAKDELGNYIIFFLLIQFSLNFEQTKSKVNLFLFARTS